MQPIQGKVRTFIREEIEEYDFPVGKSISWGDRPLTKLGIVKKIDMVSVSRIRRGLGYPVCTFRELINKIASAAAWNSKFNLMYRGQTCDYKNSKNKTILYPTIFRPQKGKSRLTGTTIKKRFDLLQKKVLNFRQNRNKFTLSPGLYFHRENQLAILQHYGICATPLIDITQSLRVAASFALWKQAQSGYLYVLGFPYPYGSISYFTDLNIILIKLQSVCPSEALRPQFQEGWLAGRYSLSHKREAGDNAAYRLIAKFFLDNQNNQFWDDYFQPIPEEALMPMEDSFRDHLEKATEE